MSYYAGLDVSVKSVTICVVDSDGTITARGEVSSDPDQIATFVDNTHPMQSVLSTKAGFFRSG